MPALYPDNRRKKAQVCKAHFRVLQDRFGLTDALARDFAAATADAWASWRGIKAELEEMEGKRERGRGRRPNRQAVERLRRREGLQWAKYEGALGRLKELVGKNGHMAPRPTPADLLAQMRDEGADAE